MKFESLGLHPDILKGIQDAGFEHCTPVQEQSLPECLAGKDVIAQSQTGSGKTAVFLLTIFSRLASEPGPSGKPRALVVVPTRELAVQVMDDSVKLGKHLPFSSVAVYGGVEYNKQTDALKKGVDLVVATPGRMIDLYKSRSLSLDEIEIFVIDEADRMFDMGFAPDVMYIASKLPKKKPRQTMLFSATIDENVRRLASRYMKPDPAVIEIEPEQVTVNAIDQKVVYCSNEEKVPVLLTLLKRPDVERAIIFTNMKRTAETVGWKLAGNGITAKVLTGDISQDRRQKIIDGMKSGKLKTLVATDVAARGLHIEAVSHVINYDLPDDAANYVHRIGRTARAGKSGKAYSLVCEDHALNLPEIEKYIERKIESEWIEDSEMAKDASGEAPERRRHFERREKKPGERFEKRGKRPEKPRHGAPQGGAPKEKKPHQPQAAPKPAPAGEKPAHARKTERPGGPGQGSRPRRRHGRRFPERKEGQPERKEGQPHRPPREARHAEKPVKTIAPPAEPPLTYSRAAVPEPKPEPAKAETPKETKEKTGILKRFLKFLKKP